MNKLLGLLFVSFLFPMNMVNKNIDGYNFHIIKDMTANKGMVVSAHPLASEVGLSILRQGGNAVDAAIAVQFALAVVHPSAGNIGGGGFAVIHLAGGKNTTIDFREKAPGKAFRDMYLDKDGNPLLEKSQNGHLAAGVPGSVAGMFAAHKYGKLPMKKLIQPAIDLAERGIRLTRMEAEGLNDNKKDFSKYNTIPSVFESRSDWKEGDSLLQKDLAATLTRIRDKGQKGFYEGKTAKLIIDEMKRGGGIITLQDLKNYKAIERAPITFAYKGAKVVTMPLPSSGGIILEQMLKMSEMYDLSQMKFDSPEAVNLMIEIERRAFADRGKYLGDQDFYHVPVKTLVSDTYLKERMSTFVPGKAGNSKDIREGIIHESEQTTHFSIIDKDGNAVAITTTINNSYGNKVVVGHAGFLLNDEMDDFSVKPGVPNMFGAVGQEANAIQPNKRMLSSMTPTIVLKNNKPYLVVGTPGGTTIITSVYQTIVDIMDFGLTAHDAVNEPKFHHQWLPDVVYLEKGFPDSTKQALEKMGYEIKWRGAIGRTDIIEVNKDGRYNGVADRRGDDSAAGY